MTDPITTDELLSDLALDALAHHMQTEWAGPYMARIGDFTREEVRAGKLRKADLEASAEAKAEVRRAMESVIGAVAADRPEPFRPDWRSHPGDTLAEILRERKLTQTALAQGMGISQGQVSLLLAGKRPVTPFLAVRLERALGAPSAEFWAKRQSDHDLQEQRERLEGRG